MGTEKDGEGYENSLKQVLDSLTPIDDPVVWDRMNGKKSRIYVDARC